MGTPKTKFTLTDIITYLEKNLDLIWIDKLVYDSKTKKYRKGLIKDFNKPTYIYVEVGYKHRRLMKLDISNSKFILIDNMRTKIDDSVEWQNYLSKKEEMIQTVVL